MLERRLEKEWEKEERGGEGRGKRISKGGNEEEASRNKETQRDTERREMVLVENMCPVVEKVEPETKQDHGSNS